MTDGPCPFEHDDAAYVLGALTREDRLAYEEHLPTCPRCSAAVAELAGLPGLLARLPAVPGTATPPPVPEPVLPGLLAAVRRARLRRRAWGAVAALAAAAVLVAGTVAVTGRPDPGPAGVPVSLVAVRDVPVHLDVRLEGVAWGTRVTMTCRYDGPAGGADDSPRSYELVVVPADASGSQTVARWRALPGRDAHVTGSTDLPADDIALVQLRDTTGTVLLAGSP